MYHKLLQDFMAIISMTKQIKNTILVMLGFIIVSAYIARIYNSIQTITNYSGIRFVVKSEGSERRYCDESCDIDLQSIFVNKYNLSYTYILLKYFLELGGYFYLTSYLGCFLCRYLDSLIGARVLALLCNRKRQTLSNSVPIAGSLIIMSQTLFYLSETNVSQTTLKTCNYVSRVKK